LSESNYSFKAVLFGESKTYSTTSVSVSQTNNLFIVHTMHIIHELINPKLISKSQSQIKFLSYLMVVYYLKYLYTWL